MHMTSNKDLLVNLKDHRVSEMEVSNKTLGSVEGYTEMNTKTVVNNCIYDITVKKIL